MEKGYVCSSFLCVGISVPKKHNRKREEIEWNILQAVRK